MKPNFHLSRKLMTALISAAIILGALVPLFNSCRSDSSVTICPGNYGDIHDKSFLTTICLVPLDKISKIQLEELSANFQKNFTDSVWYPYEFIILDGMASPDSCLNAYKTRLSAKKMIAFLENRYGDIASRKSKQKKVDYPNYFIIGVTNRDIATNAHGKDDYGILGLSYLSRHKASIISTYRLKNRKDLWKLALHEFGHGYFGAPHCPKDDPNCIMQDAKGGNPHFERKNSLCKVCFLACDVSF